MRWAELPPKLAQPSAVIGAVASGRRKGNLGIRIFIEEVRCMSVAVFMEIEQSSREDDLCQRKGEFPF